METEPLELTKPEPRGRFAAGNSNELTDMVLRPRRRWPALLAGAALGVAGTLMAAEALDTSDDESGLGSDVEIELVTAPVEIRDLIEEVEWSADLGYGPTTDVVAADEFTVTAGEQLGSLLERGDVLYEADNNPVVVFYGELPSWRNLAEGDEGPDVEQLETNLVALGYDPDATVTIDDTFTFNTALMVERWQEDIGAEITGELQLGAAVTVAGPVSVTAAPVVGQRAHAGSLVASLSTRSQTTTTVATLTGEISELPDLGTQVEHGTVLYRVGDIDVVALTTLDSIARLLVDPDTDPVALESALALSGYDPDNEILIDGSYDEATSNAVARWQLDTGVPATGQIGPDAYVVSEAGLTVSAHLVAQDQTLAAPHPALELSEPTLSVVVPVGLADQGDFLVGQQLQVELPDGEVVRALVVEVGSVAVTSPAGSDPIIEVIVELTEPVDANLPTSEVTVVVAGETITDALVVPTRALVTLAEGGFAVEKVLSDGGAILVAVEPGTFDDGVVEVFTSQLAPGDALVVPQ